jgi:O-antigen/teichoic acid export membrane protein
VKSSIFKRTIIYTFSASLNALVAFLLLPVLTRYLSPFDYGVVETFMAVVACLTGVVIIGGNTLMSRDYFVLEGSARQEYAGNILGMIFIASVSLLILYIFSSIWEDFWSNILKISNALIILAIVVSCGNAVVAMLSTTFQLEKKAVSYAIFMNSRTFFEISLSLFLIIGVGLTWDGRISGIAASIILFGAAALYLFKSRNITIHLPTKYGKQILLLGAPLILSHLGGWVYGMVDKIMINNLIGVDATGLYSVGYRFGMVVMMVETAFSLAWLPFFFENIAQKKHENNVKIVKATYIYILFLIFFSVSFGLLGKYLLYFMVDERFFGAAQFIFLISIAYCFDGIWKMFLGYIIFLGRMKTYSTITIVAAIIQIILNYIMINAFGLIGAAWATFISMMIGALITITVAIKSYHMPWLLLRPASDYR